MGNQESPFPRVADTQKCLRVSGKPWQEWEIYSEAAPDEVYILRTKYSSSEKAWEEWELVPDFGESTGRVEFNTRYIGGDKNWESWDLRDNLPEASSEIKMASSFLMLFSTIMPYCHPKARCAFNGLPLKGKVKFVEHGEDIKIKYVDYDADIKVQFVEWGADDCGQWQKVDYGEDLKVRIVDWNEDLKVEKVDYSPGMRD